MSSTETTRKSKPLACRPKKGQWFNAYVREFNKPHPAGPFKRTDDGGVETQTIEAVDAEGDTWSFKPAEFRLSAVDGKGVQ